MTRGRLLAILLLFALGTGAGLAHVSIRIGVVEMGYKIGRATEERERVTEENRTLRIQRSMLLDPKRIEAIAFDKLEMQRPTAGQIVTLSDPTHRSEEDRRQ